MATHHSCQDDHNDDDNWNVRSNENSSVGGVAVVGEIVTGFIS
jgi:hypothetical protein